MMRIAVGLMSGTSLDGVDAALVETDGERVARLGPARTLPYAPGLRRDLRRLLDLAPAIEADDPFLLACERRLTEAHAEAVRLVLAPGRPAPALVGFHGQTILHRPRERRTWQIGDAAWLARELRVPVAHDFRSADVARGGQGAPLMPVAHRAFAAGLPKPLAVLNLGGLGNVTFLGSDGGMLAFDTGPANGPLDDWARRWGMECDRDGRLALAGRADGAVLGRLMAHPYLDQSPPKSLDRLDFDRALREAGAGELSAADGAATLAAFCAACVAAAARLLPEEPRQWLVAGGGRRNPALMRALAAVLVAPVRPCEAVGWNGDALEAQGFAVLAARAERGLAITFPGTTGVAAPLPGGRVAAP